MSAVLPPPAAPAPDPSVAPWLRAWRTVRSLWRRWFLWLLLALLVLGLLVTVVWLAGRHEVEQVQDRLDRDTELAAIDLRLNLARTLQSLQALQASRSDTERWSQDAQALLRQHRQWLRLEWRDASMRTLAAVDTPYRSSLFSNARREGLQAEVEQACTRATAQGSGAYSSSHYLPQPDASGGIEVMEACVPMPDGGFMIATYGLRALLTEVIAADMTRGQEVSLNEVDGTRLVSIGAARRAGNRVFSAQQMLELPGAAFVLRVNGWRQAPDLFPNLLTALVTAMSIALVSVLVLLARDTRRRLPPAVHAQHEGGAGQLQHL
ncbi:MAG: PAS domain-containing sensor histidine kinase, partial [Comamonadaceae bacterium]